MPRVEFQGKASSRAFREMDELSHASLPRSVNGARIGLARLLIRLGQHVQSLALMVMRPDDLLVYSRQTYSQAAIIERFSRPEIVDSGLYLDEKALLEQVGSQSGSLLVLGVGGGREAIALARMGFEVTGVDFVPEMVAQAQANAARHGVRFRGLVQEISQLDAPPDSYEVVWLSAAMYSAVPTRRRRVATLRRIGDILKPGGHAVLQFHWDPEVRSSSRAVELSRRLVAWLTLGNLTYEPGDRLLNNVEFIHGFWSEAMLTSEFEAAGLELVHLGIRERAVRGGAILRKP